MPCVAINAPGPGLARPVGALDTTAWRDASPEPKVQKQGTRWGRGTKEQKIPGMSALGLRRSIVPRICAANLAATAASRN